MGLKWPSESAKSNLVQEDGIVPIINARLKLSSVTVSNGIFLELNDVKLNEMFFVLYNLNFYIKFFLLNIVVFLHFVWNWENFLSAEHIC